MLFCVPNVIYLYDLQMSMFEHFSVESIKSELENMINPLMHNVTNGQIDFKNLAANALKF